MNELKTFKPFQPPQSKLWRNMRQDLPADQFCVAVPKIDDCPSCGIWPFSTGENDPFLPACQWHDLYYIMNEQGSLPPDWTRAKVDCHFYSGLRILCDAEEDYPTRARLWGRAGLYILAVNSLGGLFW